MVLQHIGEVFAKTVNNYLRYVQPPEGEDSNLRRWPTADYWYNFISTAEKLTLYEAPGVEYNLSKLERYAVTQAGAAAAAYSELVGADTYLEQCRRKLLETANPKYTNLIEQAKQMKTETFG